MVLDIIVFWSIYIISFILGYAVSESLVRPFGMFDVYPFCCRKCLTTWLMIASYVSIGICLGKWVLMLCGVILAAAQALCFIITDKEKGLQ